MDVICLGSTFVDYFFEADEEFLKKYNLKPEDDIFFGDRPGLTLNKLLKELPLITKSPGGMSTNTAAVLSKLGTHCAYYGIVGRDSVGVFWEKGLKKIDTRNILVQGKMSICACVLNNNRKNRLFISQMNKSDNKIFNELDYELLNKAKIIHISPFLLNSEYLLDNLHKILEKIDGPRISFTPSLIYAAFGLKKLLPILKNVNFLFLNKAELKLLTGKNPERGSAELVKLGPEIIICTLGEKGVLITTKEKQFLIKARKVKNIVDSTGAGDAFAAGFLFGILKNKNPKWSAHFGSKIATRALTDFGLSWLDKLN